MRATVFALALMMLSAMAIRASAGALTPQQMVGWKIVCDSHATPAEKYAASEFQTLFMGLTGASLPIVESAPTGSGVVLIGPDATFHAGIAKPAAAFGEEELRIHIAPGVVAIDGGRQRGTLYGVYEFFEENCGVRYLTHDDTYYPPDSKSHKLPFGTRTFNPKFAFRWSYYGETNQYPEFAARLHTNTVTNDVKLGGISGYRLVNHCVAYLVPPAKYGATHPEYYALVGGKRVWDTTDGGGPQLCLTNPHVRDVLAEAIEQEIEQNPDQKNFNIAQMDNANYCTCPECKALDDREGSHSGTMIAFVNSVAEIIEKRHPDVLLSTFAYWYTRKPPKTIKPRHNVMVQLCSIECCTLHSIDDPKCALNRTFCHDMAVWNNICDKLFIWHYNTNFTAYTLPYPNLKSIGKSVDYFARHSGRGVFMQAAGNANAAEMSDLRNYVMSRCLWKPGRDSWSEALEFCRMYYRESAEPIIGYLTDLHNRVQAAGMHPTCFPTESSLCITRESAKEMLASFNQAISLAQSDTIRERVEKASLCAYRAALSASSIDLIYSDNLCRPDLEGLDPQLLDRYEAMGKKYGATMEGEGTTSESYIGGLRTFFAGLKTVSIENQTWRVVLLPGSNGKLIEMTYKPTGRNLIQAHRAFNRFRYEEWVRSGAGPAGNHSMSYEVANLQPDSITLALVAEDGTRFERKIALTSDAVKFDTNITAGVDRALDIWVHPEYDAGTTVMDPETVRVYVKQRSRWVQANRGWREALSNPPQEAFIRGSAPGGGYALFNKELQYGVEQRFNGNDFRALELFWGPARQQVNLELVPKVTSLVKGEKTHYGYEVHYLSNAPR